MKNFFTSCLGTIVGLFAVILFGVALLAGIGSNQVIVNDNSVLHIRLDRRISELAVDDPLAELLPGTVEQRIGLMQLKEVLERAKHDPKIAGVYLNSGIVGAGFATIAEVRSAIRDFRESGKWVVAYADFFTESGYYLASAADKVYLNPSGQMEFNGLTAEVQFFKGLFDKLDIKPQIFRVGDFKSAVEPFMRDDLSPENRLQLQSMIDGIHGQMLSDISESRNLPAERLKEIADKMLIRNVKQAVEFGLVDSLYYDDQVKDELRERLNIAEDRPVLFVSYSDYRAYSEEVSTSKNEIAVIVADGEIVPGKASEDFVGSETFSAAIRRARTSTKVKAIVIRVNSPGGAFFAGDEMWREIYLAAQEKPVIASMGDYAASGGYYLAMACDTIIAQPNTITGSIGVFSVLFDMSSFLGNKLGITSDQVKTGEVGDLITFTRPLTPAEKDIWQKQTDEVYETFTSKAAEGRDMPLEELKKFASGRVWTGSQAKDRNLVDIIGSFDDAVKLAAEQGGVADDYQVAYYPKPKTVLESYMNSQEETIKADVVKQQTGELYPWLMKWQEVKRYQGTQARMPLNFTID
jgi:protease-4